MAQGYAGGIKPSVAPHAAPQSAVARNHLQDLDAPRYLELLFQDLLQIKNCDGEKDENS